VKQVIAIGERLELFVDRHLIDKLDGTELRLHEPQPGPPSGACLPGCYATVIKDGEVYRACYRDYVLGYSGSLHDR
jgi:hypothetical protein